MCTKDKVVCRKYKSLILNTPSAVYDSLLATAFAYPDLVVLENRRIILRRDHRSMTGKVKILAGGGGGLEPAESGLIGPGMLTGAVLGDVLVAPPSNTILVAIRELAYEHNDGILLLVKNYIGDRLNFGLAVERALSEEITVKMLVIGDDSANPCPGKIGRRGLAGSVLVYKIAGALAEAGKSLDDIVDICRDNILTDLSTITLTLTPSGFLKWEADQADAEDDVTIGMGLYGQPGGKKKYVGLSEIISDMLDIVTNPSSQTNILLDDDIPVVVLVNNLGGTSKLEENVVCGELVKELSVRDVKIAKFYSGTFMPVLDSKGFSITFLKVMSPETIDYLDAPTMAFNWPLRSEVREFTNVVPETKPLPIGSLPRVVKPVCSHDKLDDERYQSEAFGPPFSDREKLIVKQIINFAADALISCENQINVIDMEVGDGDAGTMLRTAATAINEALESDRINLLYPYKCLQDLADVIDKTVGGLTGALYSIFFRHASAAFQDQQSIDLSTWCHAFKSGVRGVKCYGKTELGERTLLDALWPAIEVFEAAVNRREYDLGHLASRIACTCEFHAEETKKYPPMNPRGNSPKDTFLYPDAGAYAAAIWVKAVSEGIKLSLAPA